MSDTKIPFAVDLASGNLVEVGDVAPGKSCGCLCPSCGQGVIAKQGKINQWHFAHDKASIVPPTQICEISFYSCCRRFIFESMALRQPEYILLPPYVIEEKRHEFSIKGLTDNQAVPGGKYAITEVAFGGVYDFTLLIKGRHLNVFLNYPGRTKPQPPFTDASITMELVFFREMYKSHKTSRGFFSNLMFEIFEGQEAVDCKRWLFSPKEIEVRKGLRERLKTEYPEFDDFQPSSVQRDIVKETCENCQHSWVRLPGARSNCPCCHTRGS